MAPAEVSTVDVERVLNPFDDEGVLQSVKK